MKNKTYDKAKKILNKAIKLVDQLIDSLSDDEKDNGVEIKYEWEKDK